MYVSTMPYETKVALVEDDQVSELFFERENEYTLAGSIYKGRVTRVLPGMQSAFVDIGLERDAFLYVSDFLEVPEDEDSEFGEIAAHQPQIFVSSRPVEEPAADAAEAEPEGPEGFEERAGSDSPVEPVEAGDGEGEAEAEPGQRLNRRRRRARRGRGFPESKFAHSEASPAATRFEEEEAEPETPAPASILLPGESIAKYQAYGVGHSRPEEQPAARNGASEPAESGPHAADEPAAAATRPAPRARAILPGESIAKYQTPAAGGPPAESPAAEVSRPAADRRKGAGADEAPPALKSSGEDQMRAAPRPSRSRLPLVLPGESIAKYRRHAAAAAAEPPEALSNATFVIESEPWKEAEAEGQPPAAGGPSPEGLPENEVEPFEAEPAHREEPLAEPERPLESEPAAAGSPAAFDAEGAAEADEAESEGELAAGDWEAAEAEEEYGGPREGLLEHEEVESEDAEPQPAPEDDEFEELEEEAFHAADDRWAAVVNGEELSEAVAEAESNSRASTTAGEDELAEAAEESEGGHLAAAEFSETDEAEEFDEDLAFEEEELAGAGELEPEEAAEDRPKETLAGRAEVREPAGTAAYQRATRSFERPRGRRGNRRILRRREAPRPHVPISDLLKEGQEILVQIAKEPIGKKGARITSHIALPGRFLVYMPTISHIGVSRKITSEEERLRLKRIMLSEREGGHGGFIVRTAAEGIGEDELRADIRFLKHLWTQIRERSENGKAPSLIYHDLNLVERILRDMVTSDFSQLWVDNEQEYERVVNFAHRFQPGLVRRIKLYTREAPLFEQFGIQEEINKALRPKVWLKSGGYIVINQTEALVAIDVNTGKYVGKTARLEDTIVKTNVDAIKEIVRQIRLRDLGGIIVIDFIDMDERKNRQKVMQTLEEALKSDRSPSKVLAFNDFGLVAITRKRVKQSLERTLSSTCPCCAGSGYVKSVVTVCNEIYAELRKLKRHLEEGDTVNLRANPEVVKALKANGGRRVQDLEELAERTILIKADPLLPQEQFDLN
jgi:ribonuclease G